MPRKKDRGETESKFTCPNVACGLVFSKPLKVKNLSMQDPGVYDACPRCLTEISTAGAPLVVEAKRNAESDGTVKATFSGRNLKTEPVDKNQKAKYPKPKMQLAYQPESP